MKKRSDIPVLLAVMLLYILTQLGWWAWLITDLNEKVYAGSPKLEQRLWMVWGEGIVFASLLIAGFIYTFRAYRKETELARKQKNFLLSVTHEFKTPVASLRLFIETLQKRELSQQQKDEFMLRALADVDRLNAISENILLAAKIDLRAFPLEKSRKDLSAFTENLVQHLSGSIGRRHITRLKIVPGIEFLFDVNAMTSIISNLYENAVKYSPENSEIEIFLGKNGNAIVLKVSDNGYGISINEREKVFQKFYRLQDEETRSAKGTGLGLYIARHFVRQHDGSITIKDNSPKGTIMEINFPA